MCREDNRLKQNLLSREPTSHIQREREREREGESERAGLGNQGDKITNMMNDGEFKYTNSSLKQPNGMNNSQGE